MSNYNKLSKAVKRSSKIRIHPDNGFENSAYEMDSVDEEKAKQKKGFDNKTVNALNFISNIKAQATKWKRYVSHRRRLNSEGDGIDRKRTGGLGLEYDIHNDDTTDGAALSSTQRQIVKAQNRNLIEYFAKLSQSKDDDDCVNLEYVESLLKNGAKIDCTDKYGQTIFHEVARAWHTDVAKFMIENGAQINLADNYGRTPLHVAAAVDYPEMVECLIENGADKEAKTTGEHQTPTHFAARNDACNSLRELLKQGAEYKDVRDYKGRTPIHLAAELDRSETALLLLQLDDPAPAGVTDHCNQTAIGWMVAKMPPVAKVALDQFHTTDRANRKQYFHLHKLEPRKPSDEETEIEMESFPRSALNQIVIHKQHELILHGAVRRLIHNKWKRFGQQGAILGILVNFLFIMLWTVQGLAVEYDKRYIYILPEQWWRIMLFIMALILTLYQLQEELNEYIHSKKVHKRWRDWRHSQLEKDLEFSHPRWPEEASYLTQEMEDLDKMRPQYFNDFWNIYDWICYTFLLVVIITHVVDIVHHTNMIARLHIRIMAINIILLWLRLMKNARTFTLGPFIVMLGHMLKDLLKFFFLYVQFYIPYACAFWMLFGGNKVPETYQGLPGAQNHTVVVSGFGSVDALLFSMFRLTLVDDYDYDGMKSVDSIMTDIMVGTWLAISAVLMINIFIALLSDTFQRVYDNAKANAVMQKAIFILNYEEGMSVQRQDKFRRFIHDKCAPEEDYYDDDATDSTSDDLKKVTFQIKDQLDEIQVLLGLRKSHIVDDDEHDGDDQLEELKDDLRSGKYGHGHGDVSDDISDNDNANVSGDERHTSRRDNASSSPRRRLVTTTQLEREMDVLRDDVAGLRDNQDRYMGRLKKELGSVKGLLQQLLLQQGAPVRQLSGLSRQTSVISAGQAGDVAYGALRQQYPGAKRDPSTYQLARTAPHPRGPPLAATLEEDSWEEQERRRRAELDALRHQLEATARGSMSADARPSITPHSTTEPDVPVSVDPTSTSAAPSQTTHVIHYNISMSDPSAHSDNTAN